MYGSAGSGQSVGGMIDIRTGMSTTTGNSGMLRVRTANSETSGMSGDMEVSSGHSAFGNSRGVLIASVVLDESGVGGLDLARRHRVVMCGSGVRVGTKSAGDSGSLLLFSSGVAVGGKGVLSR